MAEEEKKTKDEKDDLHVDGDQMPYVWPEGPLVGPVWAKRAWEVAAVLLFFVLIGVIVFIATKSWPGGAP